MKKCSNHLQHQEFKEEIRMAKYKVIKSFKDLGDKLKSEPEGRLYRPGDDFPATKRSVADERIEELLSDQNKAGYPLIEKVGKE